MFGDEEEEQKQPEITYGYAPGRDTPSFTVMTPGLPTQFGDINELYAAQTAGKYGLTKPEESGAEQEKINEEIRAGKVSADKYWEDQLKAAQDQYAYGGEVYAAVNKELDKYEQQYKDILLGPQGLAAQVEGAYGAAAARGRQGAQNIRQQGQRAAAGIDAAYGDAAARAEGLAAGQGLGETTALSGFIPVSGDAAYSPTVTRAYGLAAADFTGANAGLAADELGGSSGARAQGRLTLEQWAQINMTEIRQRLSIAHAAAGATAETNQKKAAREVARQRAIDEYTGEEAKMTLQWMDSFWDNGQGEVHKQVKNAYKDKAAFLKAVETRLAINSERAFQQWFSQYAVPASSMGMAPLFGGGPGSIY